MAIPVESGTNVTPSVNAKLGAAFFYGLSSFLIIVVNKLVLTSYKFPSYEFLGLGQMVAAVVVLYAGKQLGIIHFPDLSRDVLRKVMPLPLLYLGNLVTGLGGTQKLSLPMFIVLRRFTILITMIAEQVVLGVVASAKVKFCVLLMMFGALIAAGGDLAFDLSGYVMILLNDAFTSANGVYTKQRLDAKELGRYGVLFYNAILMLPIYVVFTWYTGELEQGLSYENWTDILFIAYFTLSCMMGFILMYSIVLCTQYTSALTTNIVGVLKNLFVTYLGMFIGGDYIFSWLNFCGLNISVVGSLIYSYITFQGKPSPQVPSEPAQPSPSATCSTTSSQKKSPTYPPHLTH